MSTSAPGSTSSTEQCGSRPCAAERAQLQDEVARLRADLDGANAAVAEEMRFADRKIVRWQQAAERMRSQRDQARAELARSAGARTIPDGAAEKLWKMAAGLQAEENPDEPDRGDWLQGYDAGLTEASVRAGNDLAALLADLGATPTTGPAPEPPQAPPNPRPDLPECGATEGGMGVDCHLPSGHTCWHAAHHTPRTDGTESIGYPFDIQWPRQSFDRCPPAAPQAPAQPTAWTGHDIDVTHQDDGWATAECRTCGAGIGESTKDTVEDWADAHRADTLRPSAPPVDGDTPSGVSQEGGKP